jgi:foldase protein PrsA
LPNNPFTKENYKRMSSANRRVILALIALAVLATFVVGCGRGTVAKVNGRKITRQEYYDRLERLPYPDPATNQQNEAGATVLDRLVTEELILRLAEKEKVGPTEQQVKERMAQTMKTPGFAAQMKASGFSKDQFKERMQVEQAAFNIQTKGVAVTKKESRDFYEKNKDLPPFTTQEQANVGALFLANKADTEKAQTLLKKGVDFGTVASMLSKDPVSSKQGGRLGRPIIRGDKNIPAEIQDIIFKTKTNDCTEPIPAGNGTVIFKVFLHRPKKTQPFSEFEYLIKQRLSVEKGLAKQIDINKKLEAFRKTAKIDVAIERYKPFITQQAAGSAAPAAGGTATAPAKPKK